MAFKDLLLTLTTYPEPTPVSAVDDAIDIAVVIGARVSAIACAVAFHSPPNIYGKVLLDVRALAAGEAKSSSTNAEALLTAFHNSAQSRGIFQDRIQEHCLISEVPEVLVDYARLRDLTIVPMPDRESFDWYAESITSYAEPVIFGSGRPTLVIQNARDARVFALDTVVVAWDFSRPAARAVADALPLLEKAKQVYVVTVTNEKAIRTGRSGPELARHLARHGANVVLDIVDAAVGLLATCLSLTFRHATRIFSSWERMAIPVSGSSFSVVQPEA